jgi:hypothetical protein
MGLDLRTHHTDKRGRIVNITPHINLKNEGGLSIFLQNGQFYYEDGTLVEPPPDWVFEEMNKLTPQALESVGFKREKSVKTGTK